MYKLFSFTDNYTLPTGVIKSGREMLDSGEYPFLNTKNSVVDVIGGILRSITTVDDLKLEYGISDTDPEKVLQNAEGIRMASAAQQTAQRIAAPSVTKAAQIMALSFTDEQAVEVPDLYPEFEFNHQYKKDDRFQYKGTLYKVNQDHTSQEQWVPGETGTESLYTNLMLNDQGYQIWKQPTGAHDAYNKDDIVEYNGELYKSLIDGNVYSPDTYPAGWEKYTKDKA